MFKEGTKAHAVFTIIGALLLLVGGILALAFSANKDAYATALIVVGIIVLASGALRLILDIILSIVSPIDAAVMSKQNNIATYSLQLALGIALIIGGISYRDAGHGGDILRVFNFASLFIGIALIIVGGIFAIYATIWVIRAPKGYKGSSISAYLLAVVTIVSGSLMLALVWNAGDDAMMSFLFTFAGIFLLLLGFFNLIGGIFELVQKKKANDFVENVTKDDENEK